MWMKAMFSGWNAGSAKIRYSAAVKQEHENGRMSPRQDPTAIFKHRAHARSLEERGLVIACPFRPKCLTESDILSSSTSSPYQLMQLPRFHRTTAGSASAPSFVLLGPPLCRRQDRRFHVRPTSPCCCIRRKWHPFVLRHFDLALALLGSGLGS